MGWSGLSANIVLGQRYLQFLMPITSSMSPSYVSWVSRGVIISTWRSRIIRESNGAAGVVGLTAVSDWLGSGLVSKVASFCWVVSTENVGLLGYSYRGIVTFTYNTGKLAVYPLHHVQR